MLRFSTPKQTDQEGTFKVNATAVMGGARVTGDGRGIGSHAGSVLLGEMADRSGLTAGLSAAMAPTRQRGGGQDRGRVLAQLAVMIADGGTALSHLAVLRNQPALFGQVASDATAWRAVTAVDHDQFAAIETARSAARAKVWAAGAAPTSITIDVDATLVTAHSDKEDAAPTYKMGFGLHPLGCWLDETGEALCAILRPGNAGANDADDHISVIDGALAQLPVACLGDDPDSGVEMLVRADSAGATHAFLDHLRAKGIRFSVGYELTPAVRTALGEIAERHWFPAVDQNGDERDHAQVTELTHLVDLSSWPEGTRIICRREHAHQGAQLRFVDLDGRRFQCFITDSSDDDIIALEARHRAHARVEDRIRAAKDTGLRRFPMHGFVHNETWLRLVLIAADLLAWTALLALPATVAKASPATLRYRIFHVAAAVVRTGRRRILRFPANWPWVNQITTAFTNLRAALA